MARRYPLPGLGSVLTTAGSLVFNSELDGVFNAYHAATGKALWHFRISAVHAVVLSVMR